MKKSPFYLIMLMVLMCVMLSATVAGAAVQRTVALDLVGMATTDNLASEGWSWDADSKELYLDGLDINVTDLVLFGNPAQPWNQYVCALRLPAGTTVVLATGSTNTIKTGLYSASHSNIAVRCEGDLAITNEAGFGTSGTLAIIAGPGAIASSYGMHNDGVWGSSEFNGHLTIDAGTISVQASDAPYFSNGIYYGGGVTIKDGSVTAIGGNTHYEFSYGIGVDSTGVITIGKTSAPTPVFPTVFCTSGNASIKNTVGMSAGNIVFNSGTATAQSGTSPMLSSAFRAFLVSGDGITLGTGTYVKEPVGGGLGLEPIRGVVNGVVCDDQEVIATYAALSTTLGSCTVTYVDGSDTDVTVTVDWGSSLNPPTPADRVGYTFGGWFKNPGFIDQWNPATDVITADTTLYAKFSRNSYTVTFHPDGGVPVPAVATAPFEGLITAPTVEKTGYTFAGWWTDATEGTQWNFSTMTMPANNLDLYARWDAVVYGVTFHPGNGDAAFGEDVAFDALITAPADPTYVGRTLLGWFTAATGGDQWDFETMTMPEDGIDLYAQWKVNSYTVTLIINGETITIDADFDQTISQLLPTLSVPAGHIFEGWWDEVKGAFWDPETDTMPEGGLTLTARFKKNTYSVTFDPRNGKPSSTADVDFGEVIPKPADPKRDGYKFNGWFTAASGGDKWNFATMTMPVDGITLYAQWTRVDTSGGGSGSGTGGAGAGGSGTTPPPAVGAPSGTTPRTSDSTTVGFVVAAALIGCVAILGSQVARKRAVVDDA